MHAALGGEGGYHLRLAGGCVPSRSYLLELVVTLKPDGKREAMDKSTACTCGTIVSSMDLKPRVCTLSSAEMPHARAHNISVIRA